MNSEREIKTQAQQAAAQFSKVRPPLTGHDLQVFKDQFTTPLRGMYFLDTIRYLWSISNTAYKETNDNFLDEMERVCYEPCEFNYQCPSNLECLEVNQVKVCASSQCPLDTTCTCTATPTPNPLLEESGIGGLEDSQDQVKGLESSSSELDDFNEVAAAEIYTSQPTSTPTATPKNYQVADLPKAGSLELTLVALAIGLSLSAIGFAWTKK